MILKYRSTYCPISTILKCTVVQKIVVVHIGPIDEVHSSLAYIVKVLHVTGQCNIVSWL